VGTIGEVQDLLRVLFARAGTVHCPACDTPTTRTEPARIVAEVLERPEGSRFLVLAPLEGEDRLARARREGFVRYRLAGAVRLLDEADAEPGPEADVEIVVDRLKVGPRVRSRLHDSIETALRVGGGRVSILDPDDETGPAAYAVDHLCPSCGKRVPPPSAATLSFNSPRGACPECAGLGETRTLDPSLLFPDPGRTLGEAVVGLRGRLPPADARELARTVKAFARGEEIAAETPLGEIPALPAFLADEVGPWLEHRRREAGRTADRRYRAVLRTDPCDACGGRRLGPEARSVRIDGQALDDLAALDLRELRARLTGLALSPASQEIAAPVLGEIGSRLGILTELGLGYLTLDRGAATLSGGELQRLRLGARLGSELVGMLYVLDEPTAGLHPDDTEVLLGTLGRLRDRGNTLIVVEHDDAVIRAADHLVEVGPGAGSRGGEILAAGPRDEVLGGDGPTARALRGEIPPTAADPDLPDAGELVLEGATEHNLRDVTVRLPLGRLVGIAGVSGSGKSTLARDVLLRALRARLHGDPIRPGSHRALTGAERLQAAVEISSAGSPRSLRSVPATAVGVFGEVRRLFAKSTDARTRGYGAARFSFNRKGGRCEACEGLGERLVAMDFLPDVRVRCDLCGGRRYDPETLQVRFRGLDIAEVLERTVEEAMPVFRGFPKVARPLEALARVGLGYLPLGQPGRTLSGGEVQRLRLALALARPAPGPTLYLLDEPTIGLHPLDVARLLDVLRALVEQGHTVLVVEHDLAVLAAAHRVVELGPGAGPDGGRLVAEGTPEAIARCPDSRTAPHLRRFRALHGSA
jgi:excinuclease ABC subunit A